jgi:hypothetical protein
MVDEKMIGDALLVKPQRFHHRVGGLSSLITLVLSGKSVGRTQRQTTWTPPLIDAEEARGSLNDEKTVSLSRAERKSQKETKTRVPNSCTNLASRQTTRRSPGVGKSAPVKKS